MAQHTCGCQTECAMHQRANEVFLALKAVMRVTPPCSALVSASRLVREIEQAPR